MPKQHRYAIKQDLQTIINEINKAEDKLIEVGQLYKDVHPDYYERFCSILAIFEELIKIVKELQDNI